MADEAAQFERALDATIGSAIPAGLVNRWIAVVEVIDDEGGRNLITASSEDLKAWDVLGMLDYATEVERANVALEYADERDEDDG